jgi:hypothetical protein
MNRRTRCSIWITALAAALVPGFVVSSPVAVLDQWYDDIVETLEGVFLSASAWLSNPDQEQQIRAGIAPLNGAWRTNAVILPNDEGDPQLLVGLADAASDIRVVRFENVSDEAVTVDPENSRTRGLVNA